jgi:hypothetical protein
MEPACRRCSDVPSLTLATIAERHSFPRPACGERATHAERKPNLGTVRGRFHKLRLAEAPPHPDLLPARGEKETAARPGHLRSKRQSHKTGILAALLLALAGTPAIGDDMRYPDWENQWRNPAAGKGGNPWDPTKPMGLAQQAPLTPEYQAVFIQRGRKADAGRKRPAAARSAIFQSDAEVRTRGLEPGHDPPGVT